MSSITLEHLKGLPKKLAVPVTGSELVINLVYYPDAITPKINTMVQKLSGETDGTPYMIEVCLSLIREWDLRRKPDDKEPLPLVAESFEHVPYPVLGQIFRS